ncbi:DNA-processing protein DprA [Telmatospirillum sp. J64-1]|uniref:DNA-processing protein DprA n=1 Tax=Telmatospirillum sp. J64-1 TaxID=2502183 RepID=UPI00115F14B4|nr:DNA-processing protein DprA [Telmatospirillum sp. J64-1]
MNLQRPSLSISERLDWLRLIRSENVGPITFYRLLDRFGDAASALAAIPELARKGGRKRPIVVCSKAAALRELEAHEKLGAQLVARGEPSYPPALAAVEDAPPLLSVRGNTHLLPRPAVAMVGARNASINGRNFARKLAFELGRGGFVVASGLARGIDTAAHEGALDGGTVAVMAGGVDVVYPPENKRLYEEIVARGAVVCEMPPGTQPQASHFPRRNRIISGISLGVVVVEASPRSGSLITARFALEQGREVFAVPGSPMDPRCQGPNGLIRQGATLVQSAADIFEALDLLLRRPLAEPPKGSFTPGAAPIPDDSEVEKARKEVGEALGSSPVTVDEIIRQCQLSASVVSMVLLELELAGRLERHPGNRVSLLHGL